MALEHTKDIRGEKGRKEVITKEERVRKEEATKGGKEESSKEVVISVACMAIGRQIANGKP